MLSHPIAGLAVAMTAAIGGCAKHQDAAPATPAPPPVARIETTLQLPNGDGRVHVVVIPTGYLEASRCVIAVAASSAAISTSCAQRDLDLPPVSDQQ